MYKSICMTINQRFGGAASTLVWSQIRVKNTHFKSFHGNYKFSVKENLKTTEYSLKMAVLGVLPWLHNFDGKLNNLVNKDIVYGLVAWINVNWKHFTLISSVQLIYEVSYLVQWDPCNYGIGRRHINWSFNF